MSAFTAASPSTVDDPHKRVHYSTGLVLGVDEFEQEQAHLLERDRLHSRALHGYGTVYGLRVELGETSTGETSNELVVTPGLAVVPSGQHVCIGQPQCAALDDWVTAQDSEDVERHLQTSGSVLPVYVVLCYRECKTDAVPVSGKPCRSAEDSTVPSRIAGDFELQLRLTPPSQASENATRAFGAFLRRIQVTEHEDRALDESTFVEKVKEEITRISGQISAEDTSVTPSGKDKLVLLPASDAHAFLERAFQLWSLHAGRGIDTSSNRCGVLAGKDPNCVQLGRVDLTLRSGSNGYELKNVSEKDISVDDRPVLLETRLLQEYLAQGSLDAATIRRTLATVSVEGPETLRLWFHHSESVELTGDFPSKVEIEVNGNDGVSVEDDTSVGAGTNAFDLTLDSPVEPGDRIAVHVPLANVEEQDTGSSLLDRLDAENTHHDYLDRTDDTVTVYTVAPMSTLGLGDLEDVTVGFDDADSRQILVGNPDAETWQNKAHVLEELSDVADSLSPSKDDVLITRDGSEWGSGKLDLDALSDVNTSPPDNEPADDDLLAFHKGGDGDTNGDGDTSGEWTPTPLSELDFDVPDHTHALSDLENVEVVGFDDAGPRQILVGDPERVEDPDKETWQNKDHVLKELNDVSDTSSQEADYLLGTQDPRSGKWAPIPVSEFVASPVPTNAEGDLTRIDALSWEHGASRSLSGLQFTLKTEDPRTMDEIPGLAVEFTGDVEVETLTPETFRVFLYWETANAPLAHRRPLVPDHVVPLIRIDGQPITEGTVGSRGNLAGGVAFLFPDVSAVNMDEKTNMRLDVEILGDFVRDESGKAIDAEYVRGDLPTGDRPEGTDAGVQGGRFKSWLYIGGEEGREEPPIIDLNTASINELMTLPGVNESIASGILAFTVGLDEPITDPFQLTAVRGLGERRIENWRGQVRQLQ